MKRPASSGADGPKDRIGVRRASYRVATPRTLMT
jgi:hypothetical protein